MIQPAVTGAGLECVRGDELVRVGALTENVWKGIVRAGLMIADVSAPNPNVFYEIGLAHGIGKDVFVLKQDAARVPADFGGAHYYEYSLQDLPDGRNRLQAALSAWASGVRAFGVKTLSAS
jgi:hypothetical protein